MRYQNYIWDFDGTIFDSYPHTCEAMCRILAEEGIPCRREEVMSHLLVSFGDARRFTGMSDEAYARFLELTHRTGEQEIEPVVVPFPDCRDVLKAVVRQGGRNFLYTHRAETAYTYLEQFGMRELFADCVTELDGFPSKPAPDAVQAILRRNALDPHETIMVGDREIDGLAGRNAGIAGALVGYPDALPDGRDPASVSEMDVTAKTLTAFAEKMGIF